MKTIFTIEDIEKSILRSYKHTIEVSIPLLLDTLGISNEEFQKGLMEFYQKKHLEDLPNQKSILERMLEQSDKKYFVGEESKLPKWYDEYVVQLLNSKLN